MRGRWSGGIPSELTQLAQQFGAWRRTREIGTRIPEPLWERAVELAGRYGLSRTASVLKLGYYELKKRAGQRAASPESSWESSLPSRFVELPAGSLAGTAECVVEFEKSGGSRVRIQFKGCGIADLVTLGRSFWDAP